MVAVLTSSTLNIVLRVGPKVHLSFPEDGTGKLE